MGFDDPAGGSGEMVRATAAEMRFAMRFGWGLGVYPKSAPLCEVLEHS